MRVRGELCPILLCGALACSIDPSADLGLIMLRHMKVCHPDIFRIIEPLAGDVASKMRLQADAQARRN